LGLPPEAVEITVLDEGGSGILGLGSRQARVRISILAEGEEEQQEETPKPAGDKDQILSLTEEIVSELLEKMNLEASVVARYGEESDNLPHAPILVDISGSDLSILIGRRAKTLNALQYITRLILGKELEHGIPLSIDVEGYRERREIQVRQLARRVADQVADSQREQALEPMPPNERRFAHIELKDEPRVYTESIGLDPQRKVIIYPSE
ncbi:MAG: Jag N-terminal domain-containing protein, partial [Anaerolineales bacterium]|nr:Jag N-terminal domain-containing protein [Anaerolineales bacterium]